MFTAWNTAQAQQHSTIARKRFEPIACAMRSTVAVFFLFGAVCPFPIFSVRSVFFSFTFIISVFASIFFEFPFMRKLPHSLIIQYTRFSDNHLRQIYYFCSAVAFLRGLMYNYFKRSRHSDRLKHGRITRTGFAAYTEENTMYDLHTHSRCSDGSESPEHVAELAKAAGIELLALTDHDCVRGVPAALSRAAQLGLRMLPGVEAKADYADTLHILGIGQDIDAPCFQKLLAEQTALREERNRLLEIKLRKMGMDVSDYLIRSESTTRVNYAAALTAAGHAENTADAFRRILNSDALADIKQKRPSPQAVIDAVTGAGGAAILAHPMLMKKCDPHELVRDLADKGIWGIEAFYGAATEGETRLFSSLSREFGLFATCGSDFHGKSRPNAPIGSGWRSCAQLEAALSELCRRFFRT